MKRLKFRMVAGLLVAVLFFPCKVHAVSASSAILVDGSTGRVLYEKNANSRALIASTTKIMTALVVCEQCNVLDRVKIPAEAVGVEGSSMYLKEGEVLTVQELLYGMMLHSGNDAATALAIYCGGTVEGFAELMNDKAYRLGLNDTHFENPHGLDSPNHYSTATDLAVLAVYAMENPVFRATVSARNVKIGDRYLTNHNKLLWRIEGADGVKTGYTKAAGRILVSSATRNDRRLIAVTINAPDDWNDHAVLLESGFREFSVEQIVDGGQVVGSMDVLNGSKTSVDLVAESDFAYALRKEEAVTLSVQTKGFAYAPVAEGEPAGIAYVCLDGKVIGKIPLVYADTIQQEAEEKTSFWKRLLGE